MLVHVLKAPSYYGEHGVGHFDFFTDVFVELIRDPHTPQYPSITLAYTNDAYVRIHAHGGCTTSYIMIALGYVN
jgi:hypothetical protein